MQWWGRTKNEFNKIINKTIGNKIEIKWEEHQWQNSKYPKWLFIQELISQSIIDKADPPKQSSNHTTNITKLKGLSITLSRAEKAKTI